MTTNRVQRGKTRLPYKGNVKILKYGKKQEKLEQNC